MKQRPRQDLLHKQDKACFTSKARLAVQGSRACEESSGALASWGLRALRHRRLSCLRAQPGPVEVFGVQRRHGPAAVTMEVEP